MDTDARLRKLARHTYWQSLYRASKENNGIHLFENVHNFSGLQTRFLYWLAVYDMLYTELLHKESKFLSENVIDDDMRCDAFLILRGKLKEAEWKKYQAEKDTQQKRSRRPNKHKGNMTLIDVDLRSE